MKEAVNRRATVVKFRAVTAGRPADEIVRQIRELIASHVLKVGDKLPSEREFETILQVSRNSIRQAIKALADMGLLEMRKGAHGGAFVIGGGNQAIERVFSDLFHLGEVRPADLTEVRVLVGAEVARLACLRGTPEEIERLEANIAAAEAAVSDGNISLRSELNLEFHQIMAGMTRNPLLVTLTTMITNVTRGFGKGMAAIPNRTVMPVRRRILQHLREGNHEAAQEEMRTYLRQVEKHYLRHARNLSGNGKGR